MTALWRLAMFILTMLMSSFISLVFNSNHSVHINWVWLIRHFPWLIIEFGTWDLCISCGHKRSVSVFKKVNKFIVSSTFFVTISIKLDNNIFVFKPQYPHTNSPNWSLHISLKNELWEFDKRSKYFLLGDHLINSHNLISWQCMDIVRRKLLLVTIGT